MNWVELNKRLTKIEKRCCCGQEEPTPEIGCCYYSVTYAEAEALIAANDLVKGGLYKINDRGDLGIYLLAVENNLFSEEGVRNMLIPNYELIEGAVYWNLNSAAYNEGSNTVYQGFVYESLINSNTEIPSNDGINWQLIEKSITNDEYVSKTFGVLYDFENDWINLQWDEYNNKIGHSQNLGIYVYGGNLIDTSDWWYFQWINNFGGSGSFVYNNRAHGIYGNTLAHDGGLGKMHDNTCLAGTIVNNIASVGATVYGIYMNTVPYGINENTAFLGIYNNECRSITNNVNQIHIHDNRGVLDISNNLVVPVEGGGLAGEMIIEDNTNQGNISGNSIVSGEVGYATLYIQKNDNIGDVSNNLINEHDGAVYISNNGNNGSIDGNTDFTHIDYNQNNGYIASCTCLSIRNNLNNGYITTVSGAFSVFKNNNNGNIGPLVLVADVSDVIVNK